MVQLMKIGFDGELLRAGCDGELRRAGCDGDLMRDRCYGELGVMVSYWELGAIESWLWWWATDSWVCWIAGYDGELLRAGCDAGLLICTLKIIDSGVFSFTALPRCLHTPANGPIRVLLVFVSTEIRARFIIKCQLLYGMMVVCWSDYWLVWNEILRREMQYLLTV